MAVDVSIRVDGAVELRSAIRQVDREMGKALAAANKGAAQRVVRVAEPLMPTRTGRLKRSLRALGSQRSGRAVAGKASVPYAAAIHWGRKRGNVGYPPGNHPGKNVIKGRPVIWEAAQREVPRIEPGYRDEVLELIAEAIRRTEGAP